MFEAEQFDSELPAFGNSRIEFTEFIGSVGKGRDDASGSWRGSSIKIRINWEKLHEGIIFITMVSVRLPLSGQQGDWIDSLLFKIIPENIYIRNWDFIPNIRW